ncbi:hypothetical protein [[Clostridium] colinum]|uniref:hypothetical protein n=1 Tax=[Clostridium] colinum TaxID=36835 RepID=UPI0020254E2B|nr:hypothetical protein [[Clostridium] colinum]
MDIKPIDVQMFINKSTQINKSEDYNHRNLEQNFIFSEHFKKNTDMEGQKTIESSKTEEENINKDKKGKGNLYNKNNNKKSQSLTKEKDNKKDNLSFLDISI